MDLFQESVTEFIDKFEASRDPALWEKLVNEEADEVLKAAADLLKEFCDLTYVTQGMVITLGDRKYTLPADLEKKVVACYRLLEAVEGVLDEASMEEAFKRVHASNMSKLGSDGKPIRRSDGKIIKGPNYKAPELLDLVS